MVVIDRFMFKYLPAYISVKDTGNGACSPPILWLLRCAVSAMSIDHWSLHQSRTASNLFVWVVALVISHRWISVPLHFCRLTKTDWVMVLRGHSSSLSYASTKLSWCQTLDIASIIRWQWPVVATLSSFIVIHSPDICFRKGSWLVIFHRVKSTA